MMINASVIVVGKETDAVLIVTSTHFCTFTLKGAFRRKSPISEPYPWERTESNWACRQWNKTFQNFVVLILMEQYFSNGMLVFY